MTKRAEQSDQEPTLPRDGEPHSDTRLMRALGEHASEASVTEHAIGEYSDIQAMDPFSYVAHNYGEGVRDQEWGILPEDRQLMEKLAELLPRYLGGRKNLQALNIGHGPFSYLDHALEPYVSSIEAAEPAASNRSFIENPFVLHPQYNVGPKFEELFANFDSVYVDCDVRVRQKTFVTDRRIQDVPEVYDIVKESFVSCSISPDISDFRNFIGAKESMLRNDESLMIALHMVGSEGWSAGGNYPSTKLSHVDIRQAYEDAGMEVLEFAPVSAPEKAREGYEGMALLIARRRRS